MGQGLVTAAVDGAGPNPRRLSQIVQNCSELSAHALSGVERLDSANNRLACVLRAETEQWLAADRDILDRLDVVASQCNDQGLAIEAGQSQVQELLSAGLEAVERHALAYKYQREHLELTEGFFVDAEKAIESDGASKLAQSRSELEQLQDIARGIQEARIESQETLRVNEEALEHIERSAEIIKVYA